MSGLDPHPNIADPALHEILRHGQVIDDEISVIARISAHARLPEGARIVTRFGDIATLRVPVKQLDELANQEDVYSIEATNRLRYLDEAQPTIPAAPITHHRAPELRHTGAGTVVGILDWGCDLAHPDFLNPDGTTRLKMLWDMREPPEGIVEGDNRWGYGRIFTRDQINEALQTDDPYAALNYHPKDADRRDGRGQWRGSHGTHVMSIAAGNGRGGGPVGVAPEAELVFVHLDRTGRPRSHGTLGDAASLLEGLDAVFEAAGDKPCVANFSVGAMGGGHDGGSNVEAGIDAAVSLQPGRAVVNSAGNYRKRKGHAQGRVTAGQPLDLRFELPEGDRSNSEIELYYPLSDAHDVEILAPGGSQITRARLGESGDLQIADQTTGRIYHLARKRDQGAPARLVNIFLDQDSPPGIWTIRLHPKVLVDGAFDAWIERESAPAPIFLPPHVSELSTTGTLCNGKKSITVGAIDSDDPGQSLGPFSSLGPTRDGRMKPEIVAPGVRILAAKSNAGPEDMQAPAYTQKNGTSMAAPHVAGAVAVMFEAAGKKMEIDDTRALLFGSAKRDTSQLPDMHGRGHGLLDMVAAERAASQWDGRGLAQEEAADLAPMRAVVHPTQQDGTMGEAEPGDDAPFAGWERDRAAMIAFATSKGMFLASGNQLELLSPKDGGAIPRAPRGPEPTSDVFGVPAVGAGGTRIFRTGKGQAVIIDAGRGPGSGSVGLYVRQVTSLMQQMGITDVSAVVVIHRHADHFNRLIEVMREFPVAANRIFMPRAFWRNAPPGFTRYLNRIGAHLGIPDWRPQPLNLRPIPQASDVVYGRLRTGAEVFQFVALGRELRNITGKTADTASLMVKYRSGPGQAPIVVLGDLRGGDYNKLHDRMGAEAWKDFFRGVQTISGFNHHRGRISPGDFAGIQKLLRATLLETGKLTAIIQTNPNDRGARDGRAETLRFLRHAGVHVREVHVPIPGQTSSAGSTGTRASNRGPASRVHNPVNSRMTEALGRLQRLNMAQRVLTVWGDHLPRNTSGMNAQQMLSQIATSKAELRGRIASAHDSLLRNGTGQTWQTALGQIPRTTSAESAIGPQGFDLVRRLSKIPDKDVPSIVAVRRALVNGTFSMPAFRYMLSQLQPDVRRSVLYGRTGGLRPLTHVAAHLNEITELRSALGTGGMNIANLKPGWRQSGGRGILGALAVIEVLNVAASVKRTMAISRRTAQNRYIWPSLRRIDFWQKLGVVPQMRAMDDGWFSDTFASDPAVISKGLGNDRWDYLWLHHSDKTPVLSDFDIMVVTDRLGQYIHNFHEYCMLFEDTGQNAVEWKAKGAWTRANWFVRVGRDGDLVELPLFTQAMRVICKRVIANTQDLLDRVGRGQAVEDGALSNNDSRFKGLEGRATIKGRAGKTKASVYPSGQPYDGAPGIKRGVKWDNAKFLVWKDLGDKVLVSGADFDTYASIRSLKTYHYQHVMGGDGGHYWPRSKVGNRSAMAVVSKDDLTSYTPP